MKEISKDDFTNEKFKFGHAKYISVEKIKIWTQRLSYVGELGYELYIKTTEAKKIYELVIEKGKKFNLSNCGMHALDTMRMESGSPLLLCDEPIYFKDKIIGRTTSSNYSFNFKKNLAFGYIKNIYSNEEILRNDIFIEVEKQKYKAQLIQKPLKQSNFKNI